MSRLQNSWLQLGNRCEGGFYGRLRSLLLALVLLFSATAFAVATDDRQKDVDASSGRSNPTANSQVGSILTTGSILRSNPPNSRFGARGSFSKDGSMIGLDPNGGSSRFAAPTNSFQTKSDPGIVKARNDYYRALRELRPDLFREQEPPRRVTATPPKRFAYRAPGTPAYGRSRNAPQPESEQRVVAPTLGESGLAAAQTQPAPERTEYDPIRNLQQLWMRGSASRRAQTLPTQRDGFFDYSQGTTPYYYDDYAENNLQNQGFFEPVAQALGGGLVPENGDQAPAWTPPTPSPAQLAAQFREYLETMLLQSPDVNPLGPIQVDYFDGVVTLRGVVPTPRARLAAGNLVLSDPRVERVNNLLAYVREDPPENGIGEKIEVRRQGTDGKSGGAAAGTKGQTSVDQGTTPAKPTK